MFLWGQISVKEITKRHKIAYLAFTAFPGYIIESFFVLVFPLTVVGAAGTSSKPPPSLPESSSGVGVAVSSVVALGVVALGVVLLGVMSLGVVLLGVMSLGVMSIGVFGLVVCFCLS